MSGSRCRSADRAVRAPHRTLRYSQAVLAAHWRSLASACQSSSRRCSSSNMRCSIPMFCMERQREWRCQGLILQSGARCIYPGGARAACPQAPGLPVCLPAIWAGPWGLRSPLATSCCNYPMQEQSALCSSGPALLQRRLLKAASAHEFSGPCQWAQGRTAMQ